MTHLHNSQENLTILVVGTGGTIAGLGGHAYVAAQLPIEALVPPSGHRLITDQLAQIDSKDMSFMVWNRLYIRLCEAMEDGDIEAIIITHGTDTLEETAYFLHRALRCTKPVILTGAMRPADSTDSDGPRNMADAVNLSPQLAAGVWVVFAGQVLPAVGVHKNHPQNLDAFGLRVLTANDHPPDVGLHLPFKRWPRVEIVLNYAGATGDVVEALVSQKVDGIVVAGTGNGTVSESLQASLDKACKAGVAVCLTTRCAAGSVQLSGELDGDQPFQVSPLSPVQARVELLLQLGNQLNLHTSA